MYCDEEVTGINPRNRDVKNIYPHEYPQIILTTGRIWEEDFALTDNEDEYFKYLHVKWDEGEITIPIPVDTRYKITILSLSY